MSELDNDKLIKTLCYSGISPEEASGILNLPVAVVSSKFKDIELSIDKDRAAFFDTVAGMSLSIVKRNLWKLNKLSQEVNALPIPVDDLAKLTNIFAAIDRVSRLERGEATTITKHVGLSPDEAMKIINADFSQVENIE